MAFSVQGEYTWTWSIKRIILSYIIMGGCSKWHLKLGEGQCEYPNLECVSLSFCISANTRAI